MKYVFLADLPAGVLPAGAVPCATGCLLLSFLLKSASASCGRMCGSCVADGLLRAALTSLADEEGAQCLCP